jgi:hypothetical protein
MSVYEVDPAEGEETRLIGGNGLGGRRQQQKPPLQSPQRLSRRLHRAAVVGGCLLVVSVASNALLACALLLQATAGGPPPAPLAADQALLGAGNQSSSDHRAAAHHHRHDGRVAAALPPMRYAFSSFAVTDPAAAANFVVRYLGAVPLPPDDFLVHRRLAPMAVVRGVRFGGGHGGAAWPHDVYFIADPSRPDGGMPVVDFERDRHALHR